MHAAHAQTLRVRLFLEGVEVPVIAVQVQCAANSPSVATIQCAPLMEATRLYPRTTVHVFFYDLYSPPVAIQGDRRQSETSTSPTAAEREQRRAQQGSTDEDAFSAETKDGDNTRWRLLFGGEVVGFTWTKNATDRSVILQCEDWSNYWDYAMQADNTGIFGPGMKAVFSGASTNLFTDFLEGEGSALTRIVTSGKCNTFPQLKGLAAGVIRLLEAVGGSYYTFPGGDGSAPPQRRAGQNIFFSYNELRLHLTQMIGTPANDPTSERIMRYQGYSGMFNRALGAQGGQVSIRQAVNAISQIIFYEMYPQPCPKFKAGTYGEVSGVRRVKFAEHPEYGRFAVEASAIADSLNVLIQLITDFKGADPSRTPEQFQAQLKELAETEVREIADARRRTLRSKAQMRNVPEPAPSAMSSASNTLGQALTTAQALRGLRTSKSTSSALGKLNTLELKLTQAQTKLREVQGYNAYIGSSKDRHPAQLYQQVFRPDVWFAAPPRCNVLFPELYDSINYQRAFLQEPTRFMLKTNDEFYGEDELFDSYYFAPTAGTVKGERANYQKMLRQQLLEHERFTGILPVFEKMGEFNVFAAKAEHRAAIGKVGLAQRTANFLYFRHRFNARKMTVSGKFNPYVAVGCPGLIIDKYVSRDTIARHNELRREGNVSEIEAGDILGTNFLGNFAQVVHQISQQGPVGRTDVQLTLARQADERADYLGAIPEDLRVRQRVEGADAVRSTDVASVSAPALFSLGPSGGQITNVVRSTGSYSNRKLPFFYSGFRRNSNFRPPEVPVGQNVRVGDLGSNDLSTLLGGLNTMVTFEAYTITEEIPRYRREEVILPAEEYIRPGWYGDVWTNSRIGEVWNELFSTGAITDPTTINDAGRSSVGIRQPVSSSEDATNVEDPRGDVPGVTDLQNGASIQQAVEFLLLTYSYIKQSGLDIDEFIGAYTWRPIATLVDMFGTSDLAYDSNGESVVQGFEGFHSRAVGPYNNLFGLVSAELESVLGITRGSTAAQKVDIRKERREMVEKYVTALLFGNALLG
jgi:hypothetical protein